ncbi:MAG: NAD(P)H-binding protein [Nitrospirota bacterium]|jgi:NADH dehydrogenase
MILLTGASGYVGRHLAAELRSRGLAVRGLVRDERRAEPLQHLDVELAVGDVLRPASLGLACDGVDTVVHLVGLLREGWRETFQRVVVDGSRNVIVACQARGVARIVYVSALGATIDSPSRYFASKATVEGLVRDSGLSYQIWRPSLMLGRGEKLTDDLSRLLRRSPVMPVLRLPEEGRMQPLMVTDAVEIMADLLVADGAWGHTFAIAGRERLTMAEIAENIAAALGRRPMRLPVSGRAVQLAARLLDPVAPMLPVSADQLHMLATDGTTEDNLYAQYSRVVPRPVADGLAEVLRSTK